MADAVPPPATTRPTERLKSHPARYLKWEKEQVNKWKEKILVARALLTVPPQSGREAGRQMEGAPCSAPSLHLALKEVCQQLSSELLYPKKVYNYILLNNTTFLFANVQLLPSRAKSFTRSRSKSIQIKVFKTTTVS